MCYRFFDGDGSFEETANDPQWFLIIGFKTNGVKYLLFLQMENNF